MIRLRLCLPLALIALVGASGVRGAELLIENVTIVSPEQSNPLPGRHVLIRDGRIAAVSRQPIAAAGAQRV